MTTAIPLPRLEPVDVDPPPYMRPLTEIDAELADTAVRARRLLEQLAGTQRALAIVETRRRRLLAARAGTRAVVDLEQLLELTG